MRSPPGAFTAVETARIAHNRHARRLKNDICAGRPGLAAAVRMTTYPLVHALS
jgi:hypothetical protein